MVVGFDGGTIPERGGVSGRWFVSEGDLPEIPIFSGWVWGWRRGTIPEGGGNPGWW